MKAEFQKNTYDQIRIHIKDPLASKSRLRSWNDVILGWDF